ncbi:hypothetical protein Pelo_17962 [Pelomyxa schiedti]|nr:hypothetical protein Pelo_17962 [Pelomyxa schiedti]
MWNGRGGNRTAHHVLKTRRSTIELQRRPTLRYLLRFSCRDSEVKPVEAILPMNVRGTGTVDGVGKRVLMESSGFADLTKEYDLVHNYIDVNSAVLRKIIVDGSGFERAWTYTQGPISEMRVIKFRVRSFVQNLAKRNLSPTVLLEDDGHFPNWRHFRTEDARRQLRLLCHLTKGFIPALTGPRHDPENPKVKLPYWSCFDRDKNAPHSGRDSAEASTANPVCDHCNRHHDSVIADTLYSVDPLVRLALFEAFQEAHVEVHFSTNLAAEAAYLAKAQNAVGVLSHSNSVIFFNGVNSWLDAEIFERDGTLVELKQTELCTKLVLEPSQLALFAILAGNGVTRLALWRTLGSTPNLLNFVQSSSTVPPSVFTENEMEKFMPEELRTLAWLRSVDILKPHCTNIMSALVNFRPVPPHTDLQNSATYTIRSLCRDTLLDAPTFTTPGTDDILDILKPIFAVLPLTNTANSRTRLYISHSDLTVHQDSVSLSTTPKDSLRDCLFHWNLQFLSDSIERLVTLPNGGTVCACLIAVAMLRNCVPICCWIPLLGQVLARYHAFQTHCPVCPCHLLHAQVFMVLTRHIMALNVLLAEPLGHLKASELFSWMRFQNLASHNAQLQAYRASAPFIASTASFIANTASFIASTASFIANTASFIASTASFIASTASFIASTASFIANTASFIASTASFIANTASFIASTASFAKC